MKRILFVDDEPHVLESLRDALRRRRREWEMTFALGGQAAVTELGATAFDLVVCDIRMPQIDGVAVLSEVQRRHPRTVRIILSGNAEMGDAARAASVAHRFLAKPCDVGELSSVIERSLALQEVGRRVELCGGATGVSHLPSPPRVYTELLEVLADGQAALDGAAAVVERDIALSAKVLQLANSTFFGPDRSISGVREAVDYLGPKTLKVLTLSAATFQELRPTAPVAGFDIERLERHSSAVARMARHLPVEDDARDDASAAGLLHDVGQLVLASQDPEYLSEVISAARDARRPIFEVERERRVITHAEVGAHLLAVWGLPHDVVEAVAYHHEPRAARVGGLGSLAAVHIANALISERDDGTDPEGHPLGARLDLEYIHDLGADGDLHRWRALAARQTAPGNSPAGA